jgi:hypothetical protein
MRNGRSATVAPKLVPVTGESSAVVSFGELVAILDLHRQNLSVIAIAR